MRDLMLSSKQKVKIVALLKNIDCLASLKQYVFALHDSQILIHK